MRSLNSLLITTSNNRSDDTQNKTGVDMEDLASPYFTLKDGGEHITIASPQGGPIPLDPNCQSIAARTANTIRFQKEAQAMYHFFHALPLTEVRKEDFDLVFIVGGYGAMWNFTRNRKLKEMLEFLNINNIPIGLVGHAIVALLSLVTDKGEPFVKGRKLTAFSNSEEESAGLNEKTPFLLESRLITLGALYSKGPDFASHVVEDGNIVTGQNPASSVETAKRVLELARKREQGSKSNAADKLFHYR
jgi:putative intracellular protease/amidase